MDKKVRHTPAPWRFSLQQLSDGVRDNGEYINPRTIPDYFEIKSGIGYWTPDDNSVGFSLTGYMSEANARLIASAPLLLEALESIYGIQAFISDPKMKDLFVDKVYNALKLAKDGES